MRVCFTSPHSPALFGEVLFSVMTVSLGQLVRLSRRAAVCLSSSTRAFVYPFCELRELCDCVRGSCGCFWVGDSTEPLYLLNVLRSNLLRWCTVLWPPACFVLLTHLTCVCQANRKVYRSSVRSGLHQRLRKGGGG